VQTSAGQKDQEEEGIGNDLKLPAINVARTTQCRSSRQQAGRFYAAIVLAQVARNKGPEKSGQGCRESWRRA